MMNEELTDNAIAELIKNNVEKYKGNIGVTVKFHKDLASNDSLAITDEEAFNAVSGCRRKIKKDDILLLSILDESGTGGIGIAFTKDRIYFYADSLLEKDKGYGAVKDLNRKSIEYKDIIEADYNRTYVTIITKDGHDSFMCCNSGYETSRFTKYMYNFIMDIIDCMQTESE